MSAPVLAVKDLSFGWPRGPTILDVPSFGVAAGEAVFLHGPSGCGKSSLLSLMAGVLLPRTGQVSLLARNWADLRQVARDRYRVDHVGYLFQQFNLLPYLRVLDNVLIPCRLSTRRRDAAIARSGSVRADAQAWLTGMGLAPSLWQRPALTLSVGQQQRVAAARALIGGPALVIADEPTSALDEERREAFVDLLLSACAEASSALVFVSHDRRLATRFPREVLLPAINRARPPEAMDR